MMDCYKGGVMVSQEPKVANMWARLVLGALAFLMRTTFCLSALILLLVAASLALTLYRGGIGGVYPWMARIGDSGSGPSFAGFCWSLGSLVVMAAAAFFGQAWLSSRLGRVK